MWKPALGAPTSLKSTEIWRHHRPVRALAISETGTRLVSASDDSTIAVWDVESASRKFSFVAHKNGVASVAINERLGLLASGGKDGRADIEVRLWDLERGALRYEMQLDEDIAWSVELTSCGEYIVVGSIFDLNVWRLRDLKKIQECRFQWKQDAQRNVKDSAKSTLDYTNPYGLCLIDDQIAAVGLKGGLVQLWALTTGVRILEWQAHEAQISRLLAVDDGRSLISASFDGSVKVWSSDSGQLKAKLQCESRVLGLAATRIGHIVLAACEDGSARLWDPIAQRELGSFIADNPLWSCAISSDGRNVFLGDTSGRVHFLIVESDRLQ